MKTKQTLAIVSTSALAAGMAQGAVKYSGLQNIAFPCPVSENTQGAAFDLDTVGGPLPGPADFYFSFDGYGTANPQKPYFQSYPLEGGFIPPTSYVLGRTNATYGKFGLPVTPFGAKIDSHFLAPALYDTGYGDIICRAYFYQNGDGKVVGDWPSTGKTEGYLGLQMVDADSKTNFGWAHVIYDGTLVTKTITLVDWAYEDTAGVAIFAGATNTVDIPKIYSQPASQTVPVGGSAQLKVFALADPAPNYQWRAGRIGSGVYTNLADGGVISGATSATLNINGASAANMLDYIVVASNSLGAATSTPPATLTVVVPAVTPTPQALFPGVTAHFDVSMAGGLSPTYQWRKGGANLTEGGRITGATTAHLKVANVQASDAANYDVVLTLGSLSVTSAVSSLTVLPASGESLYQSALLAAAPVAYYALNESGNPATNNVLAYDNAGAYNGVYGLHVTNGFTGVAGPRPGDGFPGFAANNAAALFTANDQVSRIELAPWNLNSNVVTMTAWVYPTDYQPSMAGVLCNIAANADRPAGIRYYWQHDQTTGNSDIGYIWDDPTDTAFFWDTQIMPPLNQWSFVAVSVTSSNANFCVFNTAGVNTVFLDGTVSNLFSATGFTNLVMPFDKPEYIGTDPGDTAGGRNFIGAIDEVAVFNKALTQDQLQTIFNAALGIAPPAPVTLQITRSGSSLQLTWPNGVLLEAPSVNGPWTTNSAAVSPYSVTPTGGAKFYRVRVQ